MWLSGARAKNAGAPYELHQTTEASMYKLSLTEREKVTADWLADHGYFGTFFDVATLTESPEEDPGVSEYQYELTESAAWEFQESIEEDRDAFLACNGSQSLASKVIHLLDSIV